MRADLDALETFAASLSDAEGSRTVVGIGRITNRRPGSWARIALAARGMLVGLLTGGRRGAEAEGEGAARDAAAAGTSAEALAEILEKYRRRGVWRGWSSRRKRRVEAAARVLRGKA